MLRLNSRSPFDTVDSTGDVGSVRRQFKYVVAVQGVRFFIYSGTQALLPILIDPKSFALILMVSVPISLANLFGDFGVSEGLVRAKTLTRELASLLFWIALAIAVVAATIAIVTVPIFEAWYETTGLLSITACFAAVMVVKSAAAQYHAMLRRQLRIKAISGLEMTASVLSNGTTLTMAVLGFGVVAIPLGFLAGGLFEIVAAAFLVGWLPGRAAPLKAAKDVLKFGIGLSASGALHFGTTALVNLTLGRYIPGASLGIFERAQSLTFGVVDRIKSVSSRVFYPVLARRYADRGTTEELAVPIVKACFLLWMPPVALAAAMVIPITREIYGEEWAGLGLLMVYLLAAMGLWLPDQVVFQSLLAHGKTKYLVKLNAVGLILKASVVVVAAWQQSIALFAMLFAIVTLGLAVWNLFFIPRLIGWKRCRLMGSALGGLLFSMGPVFLFTLLLWCALPLQASVPIAMLVLGGMLVWILRGPQATELRRVVFERN